MVHRSNPTPIDKQITYRHMKHTPAMEEYINNQLAKVEEFLGNEPSPVYLHLVIEPERTHHHHTVELQIKTPHYALFVKDEDPDMYNAIDIVIDVMYRQLLETKKKNVNKQHTGAKKRE